ncbi:MAG: ROK family protein [Pseudomonadota bacterium]
MTDAGTAAVLVADVGGTNARFALSDAPGVIRDVRVCRASDHPTFDGALSAYLRDQQVDCVSEARIAAAGPVEGDVVALTNSPWRIVSDEVTKVLARSGGKNCSVGLFNDLEAVALALPHLSGDQLAPFGHRLQGPVRKPMLAINVGTGFGAACAVPIGKDGWTATATEAGHMTFASKMPDEDRLVADFPVVESILSGAGLVDLYREVATWDLKASVPRSDVTAQSVLQSGHAQSDDQSASRSIQIFSDLLARVAGDLVVAHGAWGGVYLCGSVAQSWARTFGETEAERFSSVFEAKGKMAGRMQSVPVFVITEDQPALVGLTFVG